MNGNRGNRTPLHRRTFSTPSAVNYNPHGWSHGTPFALVLQPVNGPTEFEKFVADLHVPEQYWHQDRRIVAWVHANKNQKYVPEFLLHALGEWVTMDGWEI